MGGETTDQLPHLWQMHESRTNQEGADDACASPPALNIPTPDVPSGATRLSGEAATPRPWGATEPRAFTASCSSTPHREATHGSRCRWSRLCQNPMLEVGDERTTAVPVWCLHNGHCRCPC